MFDKIEAGGGEPPTKQFWVPVTEGALMIWCGYYPVCRLSTSDEYADMSFCVPHDFHKIIEAYIVVIPAATQATANWDIYANYAAVGEVYGTHLQFDVATTYNVTINQIFEVDISGILTYLTAGDYVGVNLTQKHNDHDVDVLGVMFKYD